MLLTIIGFAVMGYHPGLEDDGVYLSAVKADLNSALYPHDADFFRLQMQATVFDNFMAGFVRVTGISLSWAELLWQLLSLYAILWAAHGIAQKLFPEIRALWAGVALLAAMFTMPVAGTALYIADQHLHPRNMATAAILLAVDRILARKMRVAASLLLIALVIHPIMAAFGISFCLFLALAFRERFSKGMGGVDKNAEAAECRRWWFPTLATEVSCKDGAREHHGGSGILSFAAAPFAMAALPGWFFESPTPEWRRAISTRTYYFLYHWTWYEWLGAIGPLVLFWLLWRYAARRGESLLARFALALILFSAFQQALAMILLAPPALVRIMPLQPMRYLQLEYVLMTVIAGCLIGRHFLGRAVLRWALFLAVLNGGMFISQRVLFPATEHLELPGRASANPWLEAFKWVRENTPSNAYFALDPGYLAAPGEDYHGFRALAERSQLADALKDAAMATQVPELAARWASEADAQDGWKGWQLADFERIKGRYGVNWVLVSYPAPSRLTCRWHNAQLAVCQIPDAGPAPTQ